MLEGHAVADRSVPGVPDRWYVLPGQSHSDGGRRTESVWRVHGQEEYLEKMRKFTFVVQ